MVRSGGRLEGKVALISGTASGQGRAAAVRFCQEGAKVVGCDRDVAGSQSMAEMMKESGFEMTSIHPIDVATVSGATEWIDGALSAYGDFDILYNNAAAARPGSAETLSEKNFEWTMTHEVTLILTCVRACIPVFRRRGGGVVINTASTAGMYGAGYPGNARGLLAHCVGKAAVLRLTEVLAIELSTVNVRVNALSPGVIDTAAIRPLLDNPGMRRRFLESGLVERLGTVDDIANAAVFLASDESSFVTGINLPVDGGQTASAGHGKPDPEVEAWLAEIFQVAE